VGIVGKLPDRGFWRGKSVFLTGHTGFKGGWLSSWLLDMGAKLTGYSLPPDSDPAYFELCRLAARMRSIDGDVCEFEHLRMALASARPEIVFHLAAQPLVRRSYREPLNTFATNVMGTANLLEAAREVPSVRTVVIVTSDKCYQVDHNGGPFSEDHPMGGHDPYSASKGCAELVVAAYRRSFFESNGRRVSVASARAGNAIGGGDWGEDRLVPDAIRALQQQQPLEIRHPRAVRPWQHVLEPLAGYLLLAERLYSDPRTYSGAWNFGPTAGEEVTVASLAARIITHWGDGRVTAAPPADLPHETMALRLDCSKAHRVLNWRSRLSLEEAVRMTVEWYRSVLLSGANPFQISLEQVRAYENLGPLAAHVNGAIHGD
jgi:CDP-glucose 4,6-dehydratase